MEEKEEKTVDKTTQNFYRIHFLNGAELFLQTNLFSETKKLISTLESGTFSSSFIKLQQVNIERERNPVFYSKNSIMSIEKINRGMIGHNTKLWEIAE